MTKPVPNDKPIESKGATGPGASRKPHTAPPFVLRAMKIKTQREFRRCKRTEWKAVLRAISKYRRGCAYVKGYDTFEAFEHHAKQITRLMSPQEWGR